MTQTFNEITANLIIDEDQVFMAHDLAGLDALPAGTVVEDRDGDRFVKAHDGEYTDVQDIMAAYDLDNPADITVDHTPHDGMEEATWMVTYGPHIILNPAILGTPDPEAIVPPATDDEIGAALHQLALFLFGYAIGEALRESIEAEVEDQADADDDAPESLDIEVGDKVRVLHDVDFYGADSLDGFPLYYDNFEPGMEAEVIDANFTSGSGVAGLSVRFEDGEQKFVSLAQVEKVEPELVAPLVTGDIVEITATSGTAVQEWIGRRCEVLDGPWGDLPNLKMIDGPRPDGFDDAPFYWPAENLVKVLELDSKPRELLNADTLKAGDRVTIVQSEYVGECLQPGATGTVVDFFDNSKAGWDLRVDMDLAEDEDFYNSMPWSFRFDQVEMLQERPLVEGDKVVLSGPHYIANGVTDRTYNEAPHGQGSTGVIDYMCDSWGEGNAFHVTWDGRQDIGSIVATDSLIRIG